MASGIERYTVIYEKAPVKTVILRLNGKIFQYLNELVENDVPYWNEASKEAAKMMSEIKAEIESHE